MDFETISSEEFGQSLEGLGINILVRDVKSTAGFLVDVFDMKSHRLSEDFAIMVYGKQVFQLHGDHTYHSHPLPSLISDSNPRGAGIEIRLYNTDPDKAVELANGHGHSSHILQEPANKPHGLREAVIVCENGYAWLPSRKLTSSEIGELG